MPVACAATAANVNDTLVFEQLFLAAFAVMARIWTGFADKGYEASRTGRGWASGAGQSSAAMPGSWRTSASLCGTAGCRDRNAGALVADHGGDTVRDQFARRPALIGVTEVISDDATELLAQDAAGSVKVGDCHLKPLLGQLPS